MDGWGIAATVFAAGAFFLALAAELRRHYERPTWSWSVDLAPHRDDPRRHRISLQLIADHPAYHVVVEPMGLELDQRHHDHDHDRTEWPHLGMVDPVDEALVLYVQEDGTSDDPHMRVTWTVPPMRQERFFEQRIDLGPGAELNDPRELDPEPWWRRWLRARQA